MSTGANGPSGPVFAFGLLLSDHLSTAFVTSVQTAMLAELPYTALRDAIFTIRRWRKDSNALFATELPAK